MKESSE